MIPEHVFESALRGFLEPICSLLDDAGVTEILVNGPDQIFAERQGRLTRVDVRFRSSGQLLSALRVVAQYAGRPLDPEHPILEAHLPDGSRVEALLPCVARGGPSMAIRRFPKAGLPLEKLLEVGAISEDAVEMLRILVECKQNVVVAGGTGSGKTSLLNALSALIPAHERTIVIEDARELALQHEHVLQLEARPADERGRGAITVRDLFRATLRLRPDRIVIGEIRGGEALDLIQAMTSGHGGCLTTVHATYPRDSLSRLETMALMGGVELPMSVVRYQLASAVDIIVQTARQRDGSRRVTHVSELCGIDGNGAYKLQDLFSLQVITATGASGTRLELAPTGRLPECLELLHAHGFDVPASMHDAARRERVGEEGT